MKSKTLQNGEDVSSGSSKKSTHRSERRSRISLGNSEGGISLRIGFPGEKNNVRIMGDSPRSKVFIKSQMNYIDLGIDIVEYLLDKI